MRSSRFQVEILEARVLLSATTGAQPESSGETPAAAPEFTIESSAPFDESLLTASSVDDIFEGLSAITLTNSDPGVRFSSAPGQWEEQGPGPIAGGQVAGLGEGAVSGAIQAIAVDRTNLNTVYVGTVNGGIWKTENITAPNPHWEPLTDSAPSLSIGTIAISPANSQVVYAGTARFSSASYQGMNSGVLKSENGGASWTSLGAAEFNGLNIASIIPTTAGNGQTVFVGTFAHGGGNSREGLWVSRDGGLRWSRLSGGGSAGDLPAGGVTDLVADPGNANRLYAALPGVGIYRSDNAGADWKLLESSYDVLTATRIRLAVGGGGASVYAGVIGNPTVTLAAGAAAGDTVLQIIDDLFWQVSIRGNPELHLQVDAFATTLSDPAARGARTFNVADASGLFRNDVLQIGSGSSAEQVTVQSVAGSTVTLTRGLNASHADNAPVSRVIQLNRVASVDQESHTLTLQEPLSQRRLAGDTIRILGPNVLTALLVSRDAGDNWTGALLPSTEDYTVRDFNNDGLISFPAEFRRHTYGLNPGGQADRHFSMLADPANPNVLFLGGDRQSVTNAIDWNSDGDFNDVIGTSAGYTFNERTNSSGLTNWVGRILRGNIATGTWEQIVGTGANGSAPHADSRAMAFSVTGTLLQADDGGIFRLSAPNGAPADRVWVSKNGDLRISEVYSTAYDPINDLFLAGNQDTGSVEQKDGKDNDSDGQIDEADERFFWKTIVQGDGNVQAVEVLSSVGVVRYSMGDFLSNFGRRTFDLTDNLPEGATVRVAFERKLSDIRLSGLNPADQGRGGIYILNAVDPARMLVGATGLYETTGANRGDEIVSIGPPVQHDIEAMAYGGRNADGSNNPGVIYVARGGQIRLRTGEGEPLMRVAGRLPGGRVFDLVLDPDNWRTIYVLKQGAIYKSTDAGASWIEITGNLPVLTAGFRTLEIVKTAAGMVLVAGTYGGVYAALNPGHDAVWSHAGVGLPNVLVTDLEYDTRDDLLIAATLGRGVWSISSASTKLAPHVLQIRGDTNPFNTSDEIRLVRDSRNPAVLNVFLRPGGTTPDFSAPISSIHTIEINGGAGDDRLILDSTNGLINVFSLEFNGGAGSNNQVQLIGKAGDTEVLRLGPVNGSGRSVASGNGQLQQLDFESTATLQVSFPAPDQSLLQRIGDGLGHLARSSTDWSSAELLGKLLPVLGRSLGTALAGAARELPERIRDPSATVPGIGPAVDRASPGSEQILRRILENGEFLLSNLATDLQTPETLRAALDSLDAIPGNVTYSSDGGVLRYELSVQRDLTGTADLSLDWAEGGISLEGTWNISAEVALNLTFGADARGFFLEPNPLAPELVVRNLRASGDVRVGGAVGLLGVSLKQAALSTAPGFAVTLDLSDPGETPDNRLRIDEMQTLLPLWVSAAVVTDPTANDLILEGTFAAAPLFPGMEQAFALAEAQLTFAWPEAVNISNVQLTAAPGPDEDLLKFRNVTLAQWIDGLDRFIGFLESLRGTSYFDRDIPFAGNRSVADLLEFTTNLRRALVDLRDFIGTSSEPYTLQDILGELAQALGIDPDRIEIGFDPASKALTHKIAFGSSIRLPEVPLSFSAHAGTLASLNTSATMELTGSFDVEFQFGVRLDQPVTADGLTRAFFVQNASFEAQIAAAAANITGRAQLGPFTVLLENGSVTAGASLLANLADPGSDAQDGRISLNELTSALTNLDRLLEGARLETSGTFSLALRTEPVQIGGLTVALTGQASGDASKFDFALSAALSGTLLNTLTILPLSNGAPSTISYSGSGGLRLNARARAFGVSIDINGSLESPDKFSLTAVSEPVSFLGTTATLTGTLFANGPASGWELTARIPSWAPASFVSFEDVTATLSHDGFALAATAELAGISDLQLQGEYDFDSGTYLVAARAPVSWTLLSGVELSDVEFSVTNRTSNGLAGELAVQGRGDLRLLGTNFDVQGQVTPRGAWIAAVPSGPFVLVPGLELENPVVFATTYDLTVDLTTRQELASTPAPENPNQQRLTRGVNLAATSRLPENVPGIGGSVLRVSGTLGTQLSEMALEAKIDLANPPEIAGLLALDSIGVRITGEPAIAVFGDGRVLHERIPGMDEDIPVRAALELDLVHTTLSGSLSLRQPVNNFFGIEGLNIIEGNGSFGINFATTPLPLPTVGFNFLVELPVVIQTLLTLPPRVGGALNISTTEPILAMTAENWRPLSNFGLDSVIIREGTLVAAPNGGSIGQKIFPRGFSASFAADLFGANVEFQGRFDEQTKGISLEAYVSSLALAGVNVTGAGPDGAYQDGSRSGGVNDPDNDNGVYFRGELTPEKQELLFSGRVDLPGTQNGQSAFVALTAAVNSEGMMVEGDVQNWTLVPAILEVRSARFLASVPFATPASAALSFNGDLTLLQTPILISGTLSSQGIALAGSLQSPGRFAGLGVGGFTLSFSTLPADRHLFVQFSIDLPGSGGVISVRGDYADEALHFNGSISAWRPITGLEFAGTISGLVALTRRELSLDFDITGSFLGSSARFIGTLAASPRGYTLSASSIVSLKLPGGQKVADLQASINLGPDTPFRIGLVGEMTLPGTHPADVRIEGSAGADGLLLFGSINDWVLVPGLALDGYVKVRFGSGQVSGLSLASITPRLRPIVEAPVIFDRLPAPDDSALIEIDVSTSLVGSTLHLSGSLTGNGSGFDLDLTGEIHLGGPAVFGVSLDLEARLITTRPRTGPATYALSFTGSLQIFRGEDTVSVSATLQGDDEGRWSLSITGGVGFRLSARLDGVIDLSIGVDITGTLTLSSSGSATFDLGVRGSATAKVDRFGSETVSLNFKISVDPSAGKFTIPNARPRVNYTAGVPTSISWRNYSLDAADPAAPEPTVIATHVRSPVGVTRPAPVQIRGTESPETVIITMLQPIRIGGTPTLRVQAATGTGDLVTLLTVDPANVSIIDIDMAGGNDTVTIEAQGLRANQVTLPATIRGGLGRDRITGGAGQNTIYGNRENATDDSVDDGDIIVSNGAADLVYGGGGNDVITTASANSIVDGGPGFTLLNKTLLVHGTDGRDSIEIRTARGLFFFDGAFGRRSSDAVEVRTSSAGGQSTARARFTLEQVSRLQAEAGEGNDHVTVAPGVTLPSLLNGGTGDDLLQGGGGNDEIFGGPGEDILFAGGGTNLLNGGEGADKIYGGSGTSTVQVDDLDEVFTETGAAVLQGGNPRVLDAVLNGGAAQRSRVFSIALRFNRDVSASLSADDLQIRAADSLLPASALLLSWDRATNTATITFPGLPEARLANGSYTLQIAANAVTDTGGNPLIADYRNEFTALTGDVNGDARVNQLDLFSVWRDQSRPLSSRNLNNDVNGDGTVDDKDLLLVRQHYLKREIQRAIATAIVAGDRSL